MRNFFNSIKIFFLVFFIAITFSSHPVSAETNYKTFNTENNVLLNKSWKVRLNLPVDINTINKDNIKILDNKQSEFNIDLSYDSTDRAIIVKPLSDYQPKTAYTLVISNIKSKNGTTLKLPTKMDFTTATAPIQNQSINANDYNLVDKHAYEITDTFTVTTSGSSDYDLSYNIGSLSNSLYQTEKDLKVSGENIKITTTSDSSKVLTASSSIEYGNKITYKVVRTIENSGISYKTDLSKTSSDYSGFNDYKKYTSPEEKIESDDPAIISKATELFSGITNPYLKAKKAFEFVNSYMTYDLSNGNKSALNALNTGRGVCEDYSELYTALLRASGVPTRIATGYRIEPSEFDNSLINGAYYRHAWPEFYLPEYGWVIVDPTFTYTYNGSKSIDYDNFANLNESSHFISGYDIDGDYRDGTLKLMYSGDKIYVDHQSYIKVLN